jgi:hypothetical protein
MVWPVLPCVWVCQHDTGSVRGGDVNVMHMFGLGLVALFFFCWSEQVTRAESSNQRHPSKVPARERRNLTNATL